MPHDNESTYTPLHVGHNAGTCPRRTIGLPPTPLPCTSGRLWWMSLWDGQSELKPSVVTDSILSPGKQPKIYIKTIAHMVVRSWTPQHHLIIYTIHWWSQSIIEKYIWTILYPQTHQWQTAAAAAARDRNGNRAVPSTTTVAASTHAEWMA